MKTSMKPPSVFNIVEFNGEYFKATFTDLWDWEGNYLGELDCISNKSSATFKLKEDNFKNCSCCGVKMNPRLTEIKTVMSNSMHRYVCSSECLINFYK